MTDEETYSKGIFSLTEWEDVIYCDHYFCVNDEELTDKEVVDLLNFLNEENELLKSEIQKLYNMVKIDVDNNIEIYPKILMEHILEILKIIGDVE